jgi:hypothetical protein
VQLLGLGSSPNYSYSQFGKERFIKLTTFKWQLLRDSLKMHSDLSGVLFTDLDVLWFRNPFLLELREPPIKILAQDDTPNGGKSLHVCSGIMYFPNTKYSIKLLDNLFNTQFHLNKSGNLTPDEPILNNWIKDMGQSQNKLAVFDPHKFIIGHRFFHFMLRKKTLRHQAVCFHLNYVVGELRKHRRAKALVGREEKSLTWFFYFVIELFLVGISRFKLR